MPDSGGPRCNAAMTPRSDGPGGEPQTGLGQRARERAAGRASGTCIPGERWMALAFAVGSTCFLVAPFPGYADLVGATAVAVTFFVGSLFFTIGGFLQTWLAAPQRRDDPSGRAAWWTATVQSAGTLFFNVTTFRALQTAVSSPQYDRLVWRPDAFGSLCFLFSGLIAYHASRRSHGLPVRDAPGWWQPAVNLVGCSLFGISAIAGYVVPSTGSVVDLAAANWTTAAGAASFLTCAIGSLRAGTGRSPR